MLKPQYASRLVNLLAFGGGNMLLHDIIELEKMRGFTVVRPGECDFFPLADWKPSSICSFDGTRVRIVLVEARAQKTGAFTRLVENIRDLNLTPIVVEPHSRLAAVLHRWGWKCRRHGHNDTTETIWYPRR